MSTNPGDPTLHGLHEEACRLRDFVQAAHMAAIGMESVEEHAALRELLMRLHIAAQDLAFNIKAAKEEALHQAVGSART